MSIESSGAGSSPFEQMPEADLASHIGEVRPVDPSTPVKGARIAEVFAETPVAATRATTTAAKARRWTVLSEEEQASVTHSFLGDTDKKSPATPHERKALKTLLNIHNRSLPLPPLEEYTREVEERYLAVFEPHKDAFSEGKLERSLSAPDERGEARIDLKGLTYSKVQDLSKTSERTIKAYQKLAERYLDPEASISDLITCQKEIEDLELVFNESFSEIEDAFKSIEEQIRSKTLEVGEETLETFRRLVALLPGIKSSHAMYGELGVIRESIPDTPSLEACAHFLRLSVDSPSIQARANQVLKPGLRESRESEALNYITNLNYLLERKEELHAIAEKAQGLRARFDKNPTAAIPEEDKITPEEASLLDTAKRVTAQVRSIDNLLGGDHDKIHNLRSTIDTIERATAGSEINYYSEASLVTYQAEPYKKYYDHVSREAKCARKVNGLFAKLQRMMTAGEEDHAALIFTNDGEMRQSHVYAKYKNSPLDAQRAGMQSYTIPYKVKATGLVQDEKSADILRKALGAGWEDMIQELWTEMRDDFHQSLLESPPHIDNSLGRRIKSVMGPTRKRRGTDHTEHRMLPANRSRMFCSEFAALGLIITANRLNDRLCAMVQRHHGEAGTPPPDLSTPLVRFPMHRKQKLSHIHPPRLVRDYPEIFKRMEPPAVTKALFQLPKT